MQFQPTPPNPLWLVHPAAAAVTLGAAVALTVADHLHPLLVAFLSLPGAQ